LGFTNDLKGVVFSRRKGAKTAAFWIPIDETFLKAVDKLERARRERDAADSGREPEPPPRTERVLFPAIGRSESRIPASEIQQMLREGRTIEWVAKAAKASREWVERLAEPVSVERTGVVRLAQRAFMPRPRLGRSGLPLGQAIRANLEERRATMGTLDALEEGWDARASRSGPWRVRFRFNHRGSRRVAEWDFVKSTMQIAPRNRLASELGWSPPPDQPRSARGADIDSEEGEEGAEARKAKKKAKPAASRSAKKTAARRRRSAPKRRRAARR
jgi:hypothetical protein